jgi:hypothetical protein
MMGVTEKKEKKKKMFQHLVSIKGREFLNQLVNVLRMIPLGIICWDQKFL